MTDPIYLPESSGSTPYVGIASFLKLSLVAAAETRDYDFLALGMPFDEDTSSQPAAHFGPWAIRGRVDDLP